jgi:hypothetical protein
MGGSYQDKDNPKDGLVAWYPDPNMPNEKPPKGQDAASIEPISEDGKVSEGASNEPLIFPGDTQPYASVSSTGETTADFTKAFEAAFGSAAPKKLMAQFSAELRSLQAGRSSQRIKGKSGTDIIIQGVSAQERENILNKYLNAYAVSLTESAQNGDVKAIAALQKGNFGITLTTLKKVYADNGIPFNQKSLMTTAIDSTLRPEKLNATINLVNLQAKTYFPALADKIDKGYTVKQLLSPYIETRANVLEEDPDMVDLKTLQAVTQNPDNLMSLYDYEISLRQDPKWRFTKNAQDSMSNVANGIAKMFGLVG